ncbi:MAG: metalloprotease [Haloarculaceae archaeon]
MVRFSARELRDLLVAWVALGIAFSFFLDRRLARGVFAGQLPVGDALVTLALSMATVGVGFLLHELAHKVVATRFGQVAEFRADYGMLVLAIGAGLAGFLFAAPGAVYHRGRIDARQNGLIAVAGPLTNVGLAVVFAPLLVVPSLARVGTLGVSVNLLLGTFNMLPFGPLDGRKVLSWSKLAFLASFLLCAGLSAVALLRIGVGL